MSDDPLQVLRVYFVIDVSTLAAVPTEAQWVSLMQAERGKPLAAAIMAHVRASQNYFTCTKRAQGTGLMKYTLCGFEIHADDKADVLAVLNAEAVRRSVTGNATQKFTGILLAELREAAVDLGYTPTQANKINITVLNTPGVFDRMSAITAVQAYLAANDALWHAA